MLQSRLFTGALIILVASAGCGGQDDGAYEEATTESEIFSFTTIGTPIGTPRSIEFDDANAYFGHDYQASEFCDEEVSRPLITKMSLATGVNSVLVQGTGLCQAAAFALRSDGTNVYYIRYLGTDASIYRIGVNSGVPVLISNDEAGSLALDDTNVYWTTTSALRKRTKAGSLPSTLYTSPVGNTLRLFESDGASVFFNDTAGSGATQVNRIRSIGASGGTAVTIQTLPTGNVVSSFDMDDDRIYWSERRSPQTLEGWVRSEPKIGGSTHTVITSSDDRIHGVTVTDSKIYWVEASGSDVRALANIRSRTNPTGIGGYHQFETQWPREGIAAYSSPLQVIGSYMYWFEATRSGLRVVRGHL